jgi:hypothetical protein|tara:strand:- start:10092 stop:11264 length:1173 start_codon:yes stop_codon:yes gene_type:complete
MANTWGALAPVNFMPKVQRYVNKRLVAKAIARTDFRDQLRSGQSIDWPTTTDMRVQAYTPGTDLTIDDNTGASDTMLINQSRAATWTMDPNQMKQAEDKTINDKLANQAAHQIASDIDQQILSIGVTSAGNTQAGGTLTAANMYSTLTTGMATLQRNNLDLVPFAVLDPERVGLLSQVEVGNGFAKADSALANGFVGDSAAGFKVYRSNNLPATVALTVDTQPANLDTFTFGGVTWTCVTDGTAAAEAEINIGANLADFQAIFITAINGTAPPAANDYILAANGANRRRLQNAGIAASAWGANVNTITGFGRLDPSETFTTGTNVFGTETGSLLLGGHGAVSLGMQIEPTMESAKEPARPMERNFAIHTLFGRTVFDRDVDLLVNLTINA